MVQVLIEAPLVCPCAKDGLELTTKLWLGELTDKTAQSVAEVKRQTIEMLRPFVATAQACGGRRCCALCFAKNACSGQCFHFFE